MGSETIDCNSSLALTTPETNRDTTRLELPIQQVTLAHLKERRQMNYAITVMQSGVQATIGKVQKFTLLE